MQINQEMKETPLRTFTSMNQNQSPLSDPQGGSYLTRQMKMVRFTVSPLLKRLQVNKNNPCKSHQPNGQWIIHLDKRKTTGRRQVHHRLIDQMTKETMW